MRGENEPPTVHDTLLLITLCSCWVRFRTPPSDPPISGPYNDTSNVSVR